ncbi:hypothetical protein C8N43_3131 [Litoreibacter ponti]|uniref:DUF1489 family protein n=1 Tax=Litoreibacter ponti TaxID=1510457 RepID=A0A2T6BE26_9RHOB|nr:DUF1489 domain-containing protein [Litoreibacter ponti]PTX54317.1 hypothetical protein C8N43_3131 [Litoreibacter ponti]
MTYVNLIKLSVGTESVESLQAWQDSPRPKGADGLPRHVTRMWPKREAELVNGGSIYWVIKGVVQARQKIIRLDEYDRGDGIRRCALVFDPKLIRVAPVLKKPFQGWRYLKPEDSPPDLTERRAKEDALPPELSAALADIGIL